VAFVNSDDFGSAPSSIPLTGNVIQGNLIGTDASGTQPVPNAAGIVFRTDYGTPHYVSRNTTIGGSAPGAGNIIAFNYGPGVGIPGDATYMNPYSTDVRIEGNSIHDNASLGIDLGDIPRANGVYYSSGNGGTHVIPNGVNSNTTNDAANHVGGNDLMNFPVLTAAYNTGNGSTITGTLATGTANGQPFLPNTSVTIDFYANAHTDPSGYGHGQTYLGSWTGTTDASGNVSFVANLGTAIPAWEDWVSATATDTTSGTQQYGDTSEFSADLKVAVATYIAADLSQSAPDAAYLTLTAADVTPADQQANFTYAVNWGDNSGGSVSGPGSGTAASHTYAQDGAYTVRVTATDQDGRVSPAATALVVVSHTAGDRITLGGSAGGQVQLQVANQSAENGTYGPTDLVYVSGQSGSDTYTVNFGSTLTTSLALAGTGNDTLIANGDASSTNVITKTPRPDHLGEPRHRDGLPQRHPQHDDQRQRHLAELRQRPRRQYRHQRRAGDEHHHHHGHRGQRRGHQRRPSHQ
jgi:hypothetical protein